MLCLRSCTVSGREQCAGLFAESTSVGTHTEPESRARRMPGEKIASSMCVFDFGDSDDPQEAFSGLLGDANELTQEMASRGVSIVYALSDVPARKQLLDGLVDVLQGATASVSRGSCVVGLLSHCWRRSSCWTALLGVLQGGRGLWSRGFTGIQSGFRLLASRIHSVIRAH